MSRSFSQPRSHPAITTEPFNSELSVDKICERCGFDPEQYGMVIVTLNGDRIGIEPEYSRFNAKEAAKLIEEDLKKNGKSHLGNLLKENGGFRGDRVHHFEIWHKNFVYAMIKHYIGKDLRAVSGASSSASQEFSNHPSADILRRFVDAVLESSDHREMVSSFDDGSKQYELEGVCQIKKDQSGKCRITTYDEEGKPYNVNILRSGEIEVNYLGADFSLYRRDDVGDRVAHLPVMLGINMDLSDALNPSSVVQASSSASRPLAGRIDQQNLEEQHVKNLINSLLIGQSKEARLELENGNVSAIIARYENGKMSIKLSENGENVGNINVLRSGDVELNQRGVDSRFEESRDKIFAIMTKVARADGSSLEELASSDLVNKSR